MLQLDSTGFWFLDFPTLVSITIKFHQDLPDQFDSDWDSSAAFTLQENTLFGGQRNVIQIKIHHNRPISLMRHITRKLDQKLEQPQEEDDASSRKIVLNFIFCSVSVQYFDSGILCGQFKKLAISHSLPGSHSDKSMSEMLEKIPASYFRR